MTRSRYRWFVIFLLFAITVVNYIDRAAIAYAIPMMQRDLGLSPANAGAIPGAFGFGYAPVPRQSGELPLRQFGRARPYPRARLRRSAAVLKTWPEQGVLWALRHNLTYNTAGALASACGLVKEKACSCARLTFIVATGSGAATSRCQTLSSALAMKPSFK